MGRGRGRGGVGSLLLPEKLLDPWDRCTIRGINAWLYRPAGNGNQRWLEVIRGD